MNYSRKVHCSECGEVFPLSETQVLASGKAVLRLCMKDYGPKKAAQDASIFARQEVVEEVKKKVKER